MFGITAPDVGQLTQRISVAYDWTLLLSQTSAWYQYAKSQEGTAWKDALLLLDGLKPAFNLASTANPPLLSPYPAIARLLGAKAVVAKRAASSRAKNKKAAATAAAGWGGRERGERGDGGRGADGRGGGGRAAGATNGANGAGAPVAASRVVTVTG